MKNYYQYVIIFYYKDNNNEWQTEIIDIYDNKKEIEKTAKRKAQKRIEEGKKVQFIKIFKEQQEIEI